MAVWREGIGGGFWLGDPGTLANPGRAAAVYPDGGMWEWRIPDEAGGRARTLEEAQKAAEKAFGVESPPPMKARASAPPLKMRRATVAPKPPKRRRKKVQARQLALVR